MPPTFPHGRKEGRGPIAVLCRVRDVFPAGFYVSAGLKWPRRDSLRVAAHRDEPDAKFENATCARRASAELLTARSTMAIRSARERRTDEWVPSRELELPAQLLGGPTHEPAPHARA